MDGIAILVFLGATLVYFIEKKINHRDHPWLLFLSGLGLGVLIGLVYATYVIQRLLSSYSF